MIQPILKGHVRAVLGIAAVLLSAFASIATSSDCYYVIASLPVTISDALETGQVSKQFHVHVSGDDCVKLSVDAELLLRVTTLLEEGGDALGEGASLSNICHYGDLLVEVRRADAAERVSFTLSASVDAGYSCVEVDSIAEIKIEPI